MILLVFVCTLTIYVGSNNNYSTDSYWALFTALSLLKERNASLDEYRDRMTDGDYQIIHLLVISLFPFWWSGWSFGQRYFSDITIFVMYLFIGLIKKIQASPGTYITTLVVILFLSAVSIWVHYRGANIAQTWT